MRVPAWLRDDRRRRLCYALLALVLAVLCFVPRPYVARAKILPQDSSSAGVSAILNSLGGQLQSFAALLSGGRPPNDLYLIIGRSDVVTSAVIDTLKLVGPDAPYANVADAKIDLAKKVDVHLLLGGVVEVEARTHDPVQSQKLAATYTEAIGKQIGALGRENLVRKAQIIKERFDDADLRVRQTETALDAFRRQNKLTDPPGEISSAIYLRTDLQGKLHAKEVEVQMLERFQGAENPQLIAAQSELAALRSQIARTASPAVGAGGPNLGGLSELSTRYLDLYRDYKFAQALYEVYVRSSEQVAVEQLVAESASYIQVIEPAHLDPERHYNVSAVALLVGLMVLALFTEIYAPLTGLFSPPASPRHESLEP